MRRKLAGTGFDEIAGPAEQHCTATLWSVRCWRLRMKNDAEFAQAVKATASWPDIYIKRDNTRGLARGNGRNGAGPARPPLLEDATVGRRVEVTVSGEWKFSVSACAPW